MNALDWCERLGWPLPSFGWRLPSLESPLSWLGVLMTQDAVQKYGGASNATIAFFESDLVAMIRGRGNHPSIMQWETFNEDDCWKVFVTKPHTVADVVELARRTDWQARPVDTDSGGGDDYDEAGDVNDIHSYPYPGNPIPSPNKYATRGELGELSGMQVLTTALASSRPGALPSPQVCDARRVWRCR